MRLLLSPLLAILLLAAQPPPVAAQGFQQGDRLWPISLPPQAKRSGGEGKGGGQESSAAAETPPTPDPSPPLRGGTGIQERSPQSVQTGGDIQAATIGLRAGFDSNPMNVPGGRGSAFLNQTAAWDFLRGSDKDGFGVSIALNNTVYDPRALAPSLSNSASFRHAVGLGEKLLLRSTLSATQEQTWSRRANGLLLRERLDYDAGPLRLFLSADGKLATLNERNIFALGGFLPENENIATVSLLPGIAWRGSWGEIGASLTLTRSRWLNGLDYIGLKRDNDRVQPNLFFSTAFLGATVEGSLSLFAARFPGGDIDDERRLLWTAKATVPIKKLTLELASARTIDDNTLPFSVFTMTSLHEAKLVAPIGEATRLGVFARKKRDDYLGLGARADMVSLGADIAHRLDKGISLLASASWRRTKETGADPVQAFNVSLGVQREIDFGGAAAKGGKEK